MKKFVLGKKLKMTQVFDEDGTVHPVTIVFVEPMKVTKVFNGDHTAVQVGYGNKKKKFSKPLKGIYGDNQFEGLKEFSMSDTSGYEEGSTIDPTNVFSVGDMVKISAISKGKGFQGVVKRHGFAGGPRSHGQHHTERTGGAIGGGIHHRVPKGRKMPGRMGAARVSRRGAKIVHIDKDSGHLFVRGSIPGVRGGIVEIQSM